MSFLFKNYSLVEVTYLFWKLSKTQPTPIYKERGVPTMLTQHKDELHTKHIHTFTYDLQRPAVSGAETFH